MHKSCQLETCLRILKNSLEEEGDYIIMKGGFDQIIKEGIKSRKIASLFKCQVSKINNYLELVDIRFCSNCEQVKSITKL
jgi:hypothetical protein